MIALLLACAAGPVDTGEGDVSDTGGSGDLTPAATEPVWGAEEAGQALEAAMVQGLPESATLRTWFLDLIVTEVVEDASCYTIEEAEDSMSSGWWEGICTGASGYQFKGGWLYQEITVVEGESTALQAGLLASFDGVAADGSEDAIGGTLTLLRARPAPNQVVFEQSCGGQWSSERESGWLGDGVGLGLDMKGKVDDGQLSLEVEGGVAYGDGSYLYFHELSFDQPSCGQAPMGQVWVRDPSASWIVFDFGTACDGCAAVSVNGEELGEQCVGDPVWMAAANAVQVLVAED